MNLLMKLVNRDYVSKFTLLKYKLTLKLKAINKDIQIEIHFRTIEYRKRNF